MSRQLLEEINGIRPLCKNPQEFFCMLMRRIYFFSNPTTDLYEHVECDCDDCLQTDLGKRRIGHRPESAYLYELSEPPTGPFYANVHI